ncbi:hypothetical protein TGAM01_v206714 [Trichoderma gamsii]|uniref:Uncharacterized protein n=1 Tax=Trichoderma gamsii TaxID=398673 RepID=A0A0W7VDS1_9HYPO|nr:hypothetical protein TGAM01_v206714 [Trichoderma gamsii]PNP45175.1 hypothetical protein TGAMA5MH_03226 [Trichoderma gamsii]PON24382.1 hypothetical protein TGAM01_v206714 [Trichoderma gamsii]
MSYYDNPQWSAPSQTPNNWEHHGATTPVRAGANGPQPQDDYAFSYQFDEVDRAHENLQKSGKGYMMNARHGRMGGSRAHSVNNFDDSRGSQGANLHNFYASQRHQSSRGSNEAEQVLQAKRRMAAQRERELRNLHTEQQYQRSVLTDVAVQQGNKHMTEEETRELIARQRSALYGEGSFADKASYIDETGAVRTGAPGPSGPASLRGHSPLTYDTIGRVPQADVGTPGSAADVNAADPGSRPQSTASPQTSGPTNKVFDNAVGSQSRTSTSSPTSGSPPRGDFGPGSKSSQGAAVAPIGTRPTGTPTANASAKRSSTPHATSGGWGRGNGVWGGSGLGAQASVWG